MNRTALIALTALLLSLTASLARADVMDYQGTALVVSVKLDAPGHSLVDGKWVKAGQYRYAYQGNDYNAYCVDIDAWAGDTEVTQVRLADSGRPNSDLVGFLYETYASGVATPEAAGGLGIAIWEVLYESPSNPFDVGDGAFQAGGNDGATSAAMGYLAALPPAGTYTPSDNTVVLVSADKQDMLIGLHPNVPEPAALVLIAVGGLAALRRRRR